MGVLVLVRSHKRSIAIGPSIPNLPIVLVNS